MRRLTFIIALLTMTAYALGLPMELHLQEHRQAAAAGVSCACADHASASRWQARLSWLGISPKPSPKAPAPQDCPVCIRLQATIAAPDAPIVMVHAAAPTPQIPLTHSYVSMHPAVRAVAARGPPA